MEQFSEDLIRKIVIEVVNKLEEYQYDEFIPVGVSNRHIHLSKEDLEILFGKGYKLTKLRDLKQPGQFAAKETVTIIGSKGSIEKVRILGPVRNKTQLELSITDGFTLGIKLPVRESGKIENTPGVIIKGPKGSVKKNEGAIAALRHIHMSEDYANKFGFKDGDWVSVITDGIRKVVFHNVLVRVSDKYVLEMHIDTDEANAAGLKNGDKVKILKGNLI